MEDDTSCLATSSLCTALVAGKKHDGVK